MSTCSVNEASQDKPDELTSVYSNIAAKRARHHLYDTQVQAQRCKIYDELKLIQTLPGRE